MCEKRTRKIKKGSQITRMREARRLQRLQWIASPTTTVSVPHPVAVPSCSTQVDKVNQNRVILELAWKTVTLMHKNRIIQQKINALQKETSEFVASVMSNPVNRQRYLENLRLHNLAQVQSHAHTQYVAGIKILPLKIEPKQ